MRPLGDIGGCPNARVTGQAPKLDWSIQSAFKVMDCQIQNARLGHVSTDGAAALPRPTGLTRLTPKGQATRERIVAAAAGEIFERGVARTSLDEVKAASGVSSSQLYHYFADKHALVLAVIEHQTDAVLGAQQPLLSQLDTITGLRQWRDLLVSVQQQLHCAGGCPIGTMGAELAETDAEARARVASGFQRWEDAIRDGLRTMHARGELDADPDALAVATLAALQGGLLLTQIRRETSPLENALDAMIDHIASRTTTTKPKSEAKPAPKAKAKPKPKPKPRTKPRTKPKTKTKPKSKPKPKPESSR
jgi:TetR/AcrR family transcriptional regulator, transcriptional repressor for nem operon